MKLPDIRSQRLRWPSPRTILTYIALAVSVLALLALRNAGQLKDAVVDNCQDMRGPEQTYYQNRLMESERLTIDEYAERFPGFPRDELEDAIGRERQNLRDVIAAKDPNDCEADYDP